MSAKGDKMKRTNKLIVTIITFKLGFLFAFTTLVYAILYIHQFRYTSHQNNQKKNYIKIFLFPYSYRM
jgi:preprotein translocase subunit SecG